jgi:hypothetical protein
VKDADMLSQEIQAAPAQAGQTPQGEKARVITTGLDIGPTLDGIGFAPLRSDPSRFLSAPIPEAVVARYCTIPGFDRANGVSPDDLAAVDAVIGRLAQDERDHMLGKLVGENPVVLRRTVDELTRTNLAMSADRDQARAERDEALQRMSTHENAKLAREVEQLRHQQDDGGGASVALQAENQTLRQSIEDLGRRLEVALEENARLKARQPAPDADE